MKKLISYQVFLARYFFWAGAVLLLIGSVIPGSDVMRGIGSFLALAGSLVDLVFLLREISMEQFGELCIPEDVQVIIPATSAVHIRGVFFFQLECTVDGRAVQSPLMALPKWSRHVRHDTLASMPKVTVYAKGGKLLMIAYL